MKADPTVSIVIPSLNQGRYIRGSIDSVLAQTYQKVECIVVDGLSDDGTIEALRTYGDRIKWISEKDSGQSNAINKGVRMSCGEICTWLCADDVLCASTVEAAVAAFARNDSLGLFYGEVEVIDGKGRRILTSSVGQLSVDRLLNHAQAVVQPGSFYLRRAWDSVGELDESLHYSMDYDLFIKLMKEWQNCYSPRTMARFRMDGTNISSTTGRLMSPIECFKIGRRHGAGLVTTLNFQRGMSVLKYFVIIILGDQIYRAIRHPWKSGWSRFFERKTNRSS